MDEMYHQIRENLRKNHYQNTQEVSQRERNPIYQYHYNGNRYAQEEYSNHTSWAFFLKIKLLIVFGCILAVSCYIYGGQDIKKGADMAITECTETLHSVEEKHPKVKQTITYIKNTYNDVCHFANEYITVEK